MKTIPSLLSAAWLVVAVGFPVRGATPGVYHDNVVIVLDASGSMEERLRGTNTRKMAAAKAALKTVLQQVPETTHIGLLVFSRGESDPWAYPLGRREDAALTQAIDRPQAGGGTPLGQFIKLGADRLLEARASQFGYGTYRLLIVTDGEANDKELVERYTPEVIARGITVDVIGVGMRSNHTLATRVHSYRGADDPESLQRAIAEVLAEVSRPQADSAAEEEAFALLAPLPTPVASAALQALTRSGNAPIGEGQSAVRSSAGARAPSGAATTGQSQSQPQSAPASSSPRSRGFPKIIILVFAGVFVLSILSGIGRRRRR